MKNSLLLREPVSVQIKPNLIQRSGDFNRITSWHDAFPVTSSCQRLASDLLHAGAAELEHLGAEYLQASVLHLRVRCVKLLKGSATSATSTSVLTKTFINSAFLIFLSENTMMTFRSSGSGASELWAEYRPSDLHLIILIVLIIQKNWDSSFSHKHPAEYFTSGNWI